MHTKHTAKITIKNLNNNFEMKNEVAAPGQ